jgi:hypothetical protein
LMRENWIHFTKGRFSIGKCKRQVSPEPSQVGALR